MPATKRSAPAASGRRSTRISTTPKKSGYFQSGTDTEQTEGDDDGDASPQPLQKKRGRPATKAKPAKKAKTTKQAKKAKPELESSGKGHVDAATQTDDDDEAEESSPPPKATKKQRGRPAKKAKLESESSGDQYEDEAHAAQTEDDDEDDDDEARPPKVTILPLEKMRDTGGVEYETVRIHENTILFLRDLKANNKRTWLKSHDGEYRRAVKDWNSFVEESTATIVDVDDTVPELPVKDVSFRIHRDIRFSKDPTPYKAHFSAAWSRTGRKGPYACYYVHCESGACFVGGGLWLPEKDHLAKLRHSIDRRPAAWRRMLNEPDFKRLFLKVPPKDKDPETAVRAFVEKNKANALKIRPMGYDVDHQDISMLRLKNFTVGVDTESTFFTSEDVQDRLAELTKALKPFVTFLNGIVMPDSGMEESDEEEEGSGQDNGQDGGADEEGEEGGDGEESE